MLTSRERIAVDCQVLLALGMPRLIERIFKLTENKINIRTEALAGVLVLYFVFVRSRMG